jgi:hypothetical protein
VQPVDFTNLEHNARFLEIIPRVRDQIRGNHKNLSLPGGYTLGHFLEHLYVSTVSFWQMVQYIVIFNNPRKLESPIIKICMSAGKIQIL